ncbi:MAG: hypothetical protein V1928_02275 [Parcubacteria group bacterium]
MKKIGLIRQIHSVLFDFDELLSESRKFHADHKVDWVRFPDKVGVDQKTADAIKRLYDETGWKFARIFPDALVGRPKVKNGRLIQPAAHYPEFHRLMSAGYNGTWQSDNYKEDGGFGGSNDERRGLRLVITGESQELSGDPLYKQTIGLSADQLTAKDNMLAQWKNKKKIALGGLSESEYLYFQRVFFEETGKHWDVNYWTWLFGSRRSASACATAGKPVSGRVSFGFWFASHLEFYSSGQDYHCGNLGCRLAGSFVLKQ